MALVAVALLQSGPYDSSERPLMRTREASTWPAFSLIASRRPSTSAFATAAARSSDRSERRTKSSLAVKLPASRKCFSYCGEAASRFRRRRIRPPTFCQTAELLQDSESKLVTLAELTAAFQANRITGHKEASTIKTENIHIRHLLRILKGNTFAQAIGYTQVQSYVAKRLGELVGGKRPVSTETVRKEIATFRVIWHWAVKQGLLEGPAPVAGLEYPKRDEKPPFMTWDKIEQIIERDGLTAR